MAGPVVAFRREPLGPGSYLVQELRQQMVWDEVIFNQWCIDEMLYGSLGKDMWRLEYEEAFLAAAHERALWFARPGAALVQPPPLAITFWLREPKHLSPARSLGPSLGRRRRKPFIYRGVDLTALLAEQKQMRAWMIRHVHGIRGLQ